MEAVITDGVRELTAVGLNASWCCASMRGLESHDALIAEPEFEALNGSKAMLLGVFGGRGASGRLVSQFVRDKLPTQLISVSDSAAIGEAFLRTEEMLESAGLLDATSGSSVCLLSLSASDGVCRIATLGNSRAVLGRREGAGTPLTAETPDCELPGSTPTRGFGDRMGKELGVLSEPEIRHFQLTASHRYLLLATDSLFGALSNQRALEIAERAAEAPGGGIRAAARALLEAASAAGLEARGTVDVTLIVVKLEWDTYAAHTLPGIAISEPSSAPSETSFNFMNDYDSRLSSPRTTNPPSRCGTSPPSPVAFRSIGFPIGLPDGGSDAALARPKASSPPLGATMLPLTLTSSRRAPYVPPAALAGLQASPTRTLNSSPTSSSPSRASGARVAPLKLEGEANPAAKGKGGGRAAPEKRVKEGKRWGRMPFSLAPAVTAAAAITPKKLGLFGLPRTDSVCEESHSARLNPDLPRPSPRATPKGSSLAPKGSSLAPSLVLTTPPDTGVEGARDTGGGSTASPGSSYCASPVSNPVSSPALYPAPNPVSNPPPNPVSNPAPSPSRNPVSNPAPSPVPVRQLSTPRAGVGASPGNPDPSPTSSVPTPKPRARALTAPAMSFARGSRPTTPVNGVLRPPTAPAATAAAADAAAAAAASAAAAPPTPPSPIQVGKAQSSRAKTAGSTVATALSTPPTALNKTTIRPPSIAAPFTAPATTADATAAAAVTAAALSAAIAASGRDGGGSGGGGGNGGGGGGGKGGGGGGGDGAATAATALPRFDPTAAATALSATPTALGNGAVR